MTKLGHGFITGFDWELYPEAEKFLQSEVSKFLKNNKFASRLAKRMKKETSTRFFDWIDHMSMPTSHITKKQLLNLKFKEVKPGIFKIPGSVFFPIRLRGDNIVEVAIKPEDIGGLKKKLDIQNKIQGEKYAPIRWLEIKKEGDYLLAGVERRGSDSVGQLEDFDDVPEYRKALETFSKRKRKFSSDKEGLQYTLELIKSANKKLNPSRTADAFFRAERAYWQKGTSQVRFRKPDKIP